MLPILKTVLSAILLLACTRGVAGSMNAYQVDFSIARDGAVISKPSLLVQAAKQASFTVDFDQPDRAIRVLLTINPSRQSAAAREAAQMAMSFFEQYGGEWILRSAPRQ